MVFKFLFKCNVYVLEGENNCPTKSFLLVKYKGVFVVQEEIKYIPIIYYPANIACSGCSWFLGIASL